MQDPRLLQDARIIQKNDRYTLPVRSEFQHQIKGQIIERSNKRATVFIEPEAAIRLNDRLIMAKSRGDCRGVSNFSWIDWTACRKLNRNFLPVWMYWLNWTSSLLEQNTVVKFMVFR